MGRQNETGATILTTEPPDTAYTNEYVQKAPAELEEEGVDTNAAEYRAVEVTLAEGGNQPTHHKRPAACAAGRLWCQRPCIVPAEGRFAGGWKPV
ncbi:hypothetical protein QMA10_11555 [Arthrobacter sp. APC 3897]|uniref:hypothetical protein n=1 Tax=Arthrobacter sp. APC 3897 TaxID=3035204 RepID=UPI0025B4A01E|nr:hypothetical protein [Arthrobacter sp. APC 3897]MDN3482556.1 hypothetical protein [Arthrobacter sp. APC 3897]